MHYNPTKITEKIVIKNLYTIHYFEYTKNFIFEGETHNFWEVLYVDKGIIEVTAGKNKYILKKDDIIFHKPNEFHSLNANGVSAPNIAVFTFECNCKDMKFFEDKMLQLEEIDKQIISNIILEARKAFSTNLDDYLLPKMKKRKNSPFGCEQLIKIYLELLLINIKRRNEENFKKNKYYFKKTLVNSEYTRVLQYLEKNIDKTLNIQKICSDNLVSRSQIQKLFKQKTGGGVIDYFIKLKIEKAKGLIRENTGNFTEIAVSLDYNSVHYFSRQFKTVTGMTPTEYLLSVN